MRYRVLAAGLRYPIDPRIVKRLAAGENVSWGERRMCAPHKLGDIIDDLPSACVAGLIKAGWIEEVKDG